MLPKDKSAFLAHIRGLVTHHGDKDPVFAVHAVRSTLALLLESAYPRLVELGLFNRSTRLSKRPEFQKFAIWLQGSQFLDAAFWLSSAYAHLMPDERRSHEALFFTPPALSTRLIDSLRHQGVQLTAARVADPSCGGCAFLAPIAIEMARELASTKRSSNRVIAHVENHIVGFELDPALCELSRAFLNMALYDHVCRAGRLLEPRIVQGNALATTRPYAGRYDVVISNPPYRKLNAKEFAQLDKSYRHLVKGQPNLYALFIDLSLRLARPRAHLGLLTPAGFFGGRSFGPLRSELRRDACVRQIDFIEPRIGAFLDVEQETALTVLRKGPDRASSVSVFVTKDGQKFASLGTHALPLDVYAPWALPRSQEELRALNAFVAPRWRLDDYGYEPKTGYLVPHRMSIPRLRRKGNRVWSCPLIWATQIGKDGVHRLLPGGGPHADIFVDVSVYGWNGILTTPSVALQRTSSKDQSRRVRCAPITQAFVDEQGGYMGENHVCFIVPKAGRQPSVSVEVLATILNSYPVDRAFRCLSGTATVSAYELRAVPMPDPVVVRRALMAGMSPNEAVLRGYAAASKKREGKQKAA
jgi:adenine-specific DNA-methyltransferase